MTALFFVLLLVLYILALRGKYLSALSFFAVFVGMWVIFWLPHVIRHINIQL
jgi:hypothetical protein